ncbi:MAG: NUDIX domain-containing protein [Clostridia bacterium]|nr:NUDIX domain-containing protein [Clostridia bacterium]
MDYPVETLLDTRFVKVFDLQYAPGKHYFDATRRGREDLVAALSEEQFRAMIPDAVSLCVVWHAPGQEDRMLLNREYRYPLGQFVDSVPAGLIDPEDRGKDRPQAIRDTAVRELYEETGIALEPQDEFRMVHPCLFSSPGLTDESNAMVRIDLYDHAESELTQSHAEGSEQFNGFRLVTREEARRMMAKEPISVYTWIGLAEFAKQ